MKITLGFRDFCGNLQETEADLNKKDQGFSNSLNFLEQNFQQPLHCNSVKS